MKGPRIWYQPCVPFECGKVHQTRGYIASFSRSSRTVIVEAGFQFLTRYLYSWGSCRRSCVIVAVALGKPPRRSIAVGHRRFGQISMTLTRHLIASSSRPCSWCRTKLVPEDNVAAMRRVPDIVSLGRRLWWSSGWLLRRRTERRCLPMLWTNWWRVHDQLFHRST